MTRRLPAVLVRPLVLAGGVVLGVVLVVAVVELVAGLAGHQPGAGGWFAGALAIAVLMPWLRPRFDALADRAAYGRQGDPYALLADFGQRISATLAVDDVLPELARTAVQATRSSQGGVRLWLADGQERRETWPPGAVVTGTDPGDVSLVVEHGGERVGRLEVAGVDEVLRDTDRELLARLAGPAGVALSNVRLTVELRRRLVQTTALAEELRRSRQRLLDAGREQRERFVVEVRRHVLPRLDAADLALADETSDPDSLRVAETEIRGCLHAMRELAAGVYPPVLAERGLAAALEWRFDEIDARVTVTSGPGVAGLPPAMEAAAYFCCVAIIEDAPATTVAVDPGPAGIALDADEGALTFRVTRASGCSDAVEQLVRDRVGALGGRLEVCRTVGGVEMCGRLGADGASLEAVIELVTAASESWPGVREGEPV